MQQRYIRNCCGRTDCNIGKDAVRGYVIAYEAMEVEFKSVAVITMGEFIPFLIVRRSG